VNARIHRIRRVIGAVIGSVAPALLIFATPSAVAQLRQLHPIVASEWGFITEISTAWSDDALAVFHTQPIVNPWTDLSVTPGGECRVTNAGYATDPSDPGHKLLHAVIIAAFLHHKPVRFVIQGCAYDKPRIISADVRDSLT
jgi:hypothetical protein